MKRSVWLLVAAAVVPHLQALRVGFLHDDLFHHLHACRFQGVGRALAEAWTARAGEEFYRPLVETTFGLLYVVFGPQAVAFRAFDLALHVAAVALTAKLALALTGRRGAALVAGALLAVHPLPGRAVCWTSDRYVIVATVFTLLAALCFLDWRRSGRFRSLLAALLLQAGGLLSKESAAAVPAALLVIDTCWGAGRERGSWRRRARRVAGGVLPFVVLDLVYIVFRLATLGDLGGYRDRVTGEILLPLGPGRLAEEAVIDLPLAVLLPFNHRVVAGPLLAGLVALTGGLLLWIALGAVRRPGGGGRERARQALGGVALGYALLLPSLPYFYLSRDLLKAYHVYPAFVGFGLAAWAGLGSRRGRGPFVLLLFVYAAVAQLHVTSWIGATRMVESFRTWVARLRPPLGREPIFVAGLPQNWRGALVVEPGSMKKTLEVLLDRRLGAAEGLGYPWCTATFEEVREAVRRGGRFLLWDAERRVGEEQSAALRASLAVTRPPLVLVDRGRARRGVWHVEGAAAPGPRPGTFVLEGRAGRFRWTGPPLASRDFCGVEIRLRVTRAGGRPGSVRGNFRWTDRHYSPGSLHRLARFGVPADGRFHRRVLDLVKSGWVGESLAVRSLSVSPGRGRLVVELDRLALLPW